MRVTSTADAMPGLDGEVWLRAMGPADLPSIDRWMREPHVARWWLHGTTADAELQEIRDRVSGAGDQSTQMLVVCAGRPGTPVGWCQWYPYDPYPDEARGIGAHPGDCGIDYAIGDPGSVGRGLGRRLIAALVDEVRRAHPVCGIIVAPEAENRASCAVLECNGFSLIEVRPIDTEPTDAPMAIYRLGAGPERR